MMDTYNRQASEYIFRENNAVVRIFLLEFIYIYICVCPRTLSAVARTQGLPFYFVFSGKGALMLTLSLCGAVGESGWGYD